MTFISYKGAAYRLVDQKDHNTQDQPSNSSQAIRTANQDEEVFLLMEKLEGFVYRFHSSLSELHERWQDLMPYGDQDFDDLAAELQKTDKATAELKSLSDKMAAAAKQIEEL